jgi:Flp pilus assembly pilin Flp
MTDDLRQRLNEIATAAGNASRGGDVADVRAQVRQRRRRRVTGAAAVSVGLVAASVAVALALDGSSEPSVADGPWEACGQDVETAAGAAFPGTTVHTDDGPVSLRLDPPAQAASAAEVYVAAEVAHSASGVDRYAVVNAGGAPLSLWVVDGDRRVVATGEPVGAYPDDHAVTSQESTWMDVGFTLRSCGGIAGTTRGDALPPGEYDVVGGVGVVVGEIPLVHDAVRDAERVAVAVEVFAQHRELVAAQPGHGVALAQNALQSRTDLLQ